MCCLWKIRKCVLVFFHWVFPLEALVRIHCRCDKVGKTYIRGKLMSRAKTYANLGLIFIIARHEIYARMNLCLYLCKKKKTCTHVRGMEYSFVVYGSTRWNWVLHIYAYKDIYTVPSRSIRQECVTYRCGATRLRKTNTFYIANDVARLENVYLSSDPFTRLFFFDFLLKTEQRRRFFLQTTECLSCE